MVGIVSSQIAWNLNGTFYRPPNSSRFNDKEFISKFEIILDTATADGKEIILLGDLNYDFLRSTSGSDTCSSKQLKLLFRLLNFKQCIVDATRIAQRSASLLDIVVTNTPNNFSCTGVISTGLSDHELVYCVRKINCKKFSAQTKLFRNYAKYNSEAFCSDLDDVDWEQLCNSTRNNMSVNNFGQTLKIIS